ncbi:isoleucine--tRNA ligase [Patescibacteria group bacterium]|nr:isoleucine--tRNA ligase [Patescibacteria group bacterium]
MGTHSFKPVTSQISFPEVEEEMLTYWKKHRIFEKSIAQRPGDKTWTFLDGPPFITGLPHYGTLLSSIPKDVFPRFWTMKGYRVRRVWGWDCHGLPAENKVENKLHIKRKKDIEDKVGVKKFIDECKQYVSEVSSEWEWYVDHIGRWADFRNAYKTMDTPYMESVMWVFKQLYEKGHIYKGLRVSLYCPHCATPISNFEVAMDSENYKDITEPAAVFQYQLEDEHDTYFLAWSTTPWNKIATPALAVNPGLSYIKVRQGKNYYILAQSTVNMLTSEPYTIVEKYKGSDLVGKRFVPHYSFYSIDKGKRAFVVIPGDFVTADEGTGIVTIAAYGEEDLAVMLKENIQIVLHVDETGILKRDVPKWGGKYYLNVDPLVIEDLKKRNLLYRADPCTHSVPTCWRCHTRLYYAPQNAWFVNVQTLKSRMKETNKTVHWFPAHFKYGRYLKSLESAPDWCISRSRYWGSPVPVWECECGERFVPGSIEELSKASGRSITDLHKPFIDEVTVPCKKCAKDARRVPEVLDSWIEAGSAPFAERHWPFEKTIKLEEFFPPDFIVEYTGQIRAWFYVLHVIATALYDSEAFKNVLVTGVILGNDGRKMSKNYGNYPDPKLMLQTHGGDALRLYLLGSPVMHGEDILISEQEYRNQVKSVLLPLWNVYNFFVTYANVDGWTPEAGREDPSSHVLDRWILSRTSRLTACITKSLEKYDTVYAVGEASKFITDLSQWYIRRSRGRVGASAAASGKRDFYTTAYKVLVTVSRIFAPIIPFVTDYMYRNLTNGESVHLTDWPKTDPEWADEALEEKMQLVREIVEHAHAKRKDAGIKVRQPLPLLTVNSSRELSDSLIQVIADEVNVKKVNVRKGRELTVVLDTAISTELKQEGTARDLIREIQVLRRAKKCRIDEHIALQVPKKYKKMLTEALLAEVQAKTQTGSISWGEKLIILTGS